MSDYDGEIKDLVRQFGNDPKSRCCVCGAQPVTVVGVFCPNPKQEFTTENGRIRHTVYGMCEKHYPLTDEQMDAIERGCAERVAADKASTLN